MIFTSQENPVTTINSSYSPKNVNEEHNLTLLLSFTISCKTNSEA